MSWWDRPFLRRNAFRISDKRRYLVTATTKEHVSWVFKHPRSCRSMILPLYPLIYRVFRLLLSFVCMYTYTYEVFSLWFWFCWFIFLLSFVCSVPSFPHPFIGVLRTAVLSTI